MLMHTVRCAEGLHMEPPREMVAACIAGMGDFWPWLPTPLNWVHGTLPMPQSRIDSLHFPAVFCSLHECSKVTMDKQKDFILGRLL